MDIKVVLSNEDTAYIIRNLFPLYLHDLSEFDGTLPNEHGILEPTPVRTLVEQGEIFKNRWEMLNVFFPFLIFVDGRPAGFDLVATQPYVRASSVDYIVHDFFLLCPYRGKGIGEQAATEVFGKFHGRWEVYVMLKNVQAQAFWRKTITKYMSGQFQEEIGRTPLYADDMLIFRFNNRETAP
jgi:predicted acetyltransferase